MSKRKPAATSTKNSDIFRVELKSNQKEVINFLRQNEITIILGDPGTGKDFCCMYRGLDAVIKKEHDALVLIKPIVEVGRSMGYLPGESNEKIAPYEKSFLANAEKMMDKTAFGKIKKKISFEPINFMRGNTYEYSSVILSEAQNCTLHELITVTTRMSANSKLFINGDLGQSDIGNKSGLKDFIEIMKSVKGVGVLELGDEFQMRNPMIVEISKKYREFLNKKNDSRGVQRPER